MPKLNAEALLNVVEVGNLGRTKATYATALLVKAGLSSDDDSVVEGLINSADAAEIEAEIAGLVVSFRVAKGFDFGTHVIKPILVLSKILSVFNVEEGQRDNAEKAVTAMVLDLFSRYTPKIKFLPAWATKWVGKKLINKLAPSIVDELFDVLHGEDD